jgi:hypothetical protein
MIFLVKRKTLAPAVTKVSSIARHERLMHAARVPPVPRVF